MTPQLSFQFLWSILTAFLSGGNSVVPDWSLPGGPKRVSFRSSQVAESYELGSPAFRGSADYSLWTTPSGAQCYRGRCSLLLEGLQYRPQNDAPEPHGNSIPDLITSSY